MGTDNSKDKLTSKQVNMNRNPTGKGGFQERPQDRSDGRWSKDNSFSYWMNFFKAMNAEEFKNFEKNISEKDVSVAQSLAYARVFKARTDLREFECVANRTEGMPVKRTEISGPDDGPVKCIIEFIGGDDDKDSENQVS